MSTVSTETLELTRYLDSEVSDEIDPLAWWRAYEKEYPTVSKMARDYLTI